MKSLRLRSVVFALVVVPLPGFGRTPRLLLDPAHVPTQSTGDSILQFGGPPGVRHSGTTRRSAAWEYGDRRNRARNAVVLCCIPKIGEPDTTVVSRYCKEPSTDQNRSKLFR
jgi:hypothetical protein